MVLDGSVLVMVLYGLVLNHARDEERSHEKNRDVQPSDRGRVLRWTRRKLGLGGAGGGARQGGHRRHGGHGVGAVRSTDLRAVRGILAQGSSTSLPPRRTPTARDVALRR